ncbi:hypothetical protein ACJJTC_014543 [Scirpophaga incertulas]
MEQDDESEHPQEVPRNNIPEELLSDPEDECIPSDHDSESECSIDSDCEDMVASGLSERELKDHKFDIEMEWRPAAVKDCRNWKCEEALQGPKVLEFGTWPGPRTSGLAGRNTYKYPSGRNSHKGFVSLSDWTSKAL